MKALLTNFHQSPQKVRLIANMIRGKQIAVAQTALSFMPQKSTGAILKLLNSAVANARVQGVDTETLFVKEIQVNKGTVMRRFKPMARGRASTIRKTMSIISLELGSKAVVVKAKKPRITKKAKVVESK